MLDRKDIQMSETSSHKRAKSKAAGKTGRTEVPLKGNRRLDAASRRKATEIERSGTMDGLERAARRLKASRKSQTAEDFADWLNRPDTLALSRLPGFIPAKHTVTEEADKGQTLRKMETLNLEILPVVDNKGYFVGIVNRSRLTASLLIDVAANLNK